MKLLEVLDNIDFKLIAGDLNKEITSVEYDSRKVAVGSLFVCVQGFTVDGHSYASTEHALMKMSLANSQKRIS